MRKTVILLSVAFQLLFLTNSYGSWPESTIRIITPFAAGNSSDIVARKFAEELGKRLNVRVYIENKPGAGGKIGILEAKNSTNNEYTFLYASAFFVSLMHTQNDAGYSLDDFIPVSLLSSTAMLVVGKSDVPEEDLIKSRKEILYCSIGNGSPTTVLGTQKYLKMHNLKGIPVPYKGTMDALIDLIEKRIDLCLIPENIVLEYEKANKLTIYKSFKFENWNGFFALRGTNPSIIGTLNNAINDIKRDKEFIDWAQKQNIKIIDRHNPLTFKNYLMSYEKMIKELIKELQK